MKLIPNILYVCMYVLYLKEVNAMIFPVIDIMKTFNFQRKSNEKIVVRYKHTIKLTRCTSFERLLLLTS